MPDTKPQAPKLAAAELRDDVLEAVVPGAAAAELELHAPGLHVELVVRNQDLERRDAVETRERGDRESALVHVALRQHEANVAAVAGASARDQAVEARFRLKGESQRARKPLDEPRSRIVAGGSVLPAGI